MLLLKLATMKKKCLLDSFLEERENFGAWNFLVSSNGTKIPASSAVFYPFNLAKILPFRIKNYLDRDLTDPLMIHFRTINSCSDNCYFCQTKRLRCNEPNLDCQFLKKTILELEKSQVLGIRFDGLGEPFLIEKFPELIHLARTVGLITGVITNGTSKIEDIEKIAKEVHFIRFSLDAVSEKTYSSIHFPQQDDGLEKRIDNIKKFCKTREKHNCRCIVGAHFVINEKNYKEIFSFTKLMKGLKVDFVDFCLLKNDKMAVVKDLDRIKKSVEENIEKSRSLVDDKFHLLFRDSYFISKQKLQNYIDNNGFCWHSFLRPTINSYGQVVSCGKYEEEADFNSKAVMGNIKEESFLSIWRRKQNILEKFKSVFCQDFGPCYFTYFNYVVSWIKKEILLDSKVLFSRAIVKSGKVVRTFDKID